MPSTQALLPEEKKNIVDLYTSGEATQTGLAEMYMVSRRTIQRALIKAGVLQYKTKKPRVVTQEEEDILHAAKVRGHSATTLKQLMDSQSQASTQQVLQFLTTIDGNAFADLISVAGHQRLKQQVSRRTEEYQKQRATNE